MSNWSKVILAWAGIDDDWHELGDEESVNQRVRLITENVPYLRHLVTSHSCPVAGMAVEVVVVFEANHFGPHELCEYLRTLPWEYPDEVEVFWKDEHAENYSRSTGSGPPA